MATSWWVNSIELNGEELRDDDGKIAVPDGWEPFAVTPAEPEVPGATTTIDGVPVRRCPKLWIRTATRV